MGLCLTKHNNVEAPHKIEEDPREIEEDPIPIITPQINIKIIDVNENSVKKTKKKSSCYKRIFFKSKITIKAVNKIPLRNNKFK